jgi:hypothetical protein
MRTSACAIAAIATLSLGLVASSADARGSHKKPWVCRPGHAHLLVADTQAQVYETGYYYEEVFQPERIQGCVYGSKRQFAVGSPLSGSGSGGGGSSIEQMVGALVAVEGHSWSTVKGSDSNWVEVIDLRTGRHIHKSFTGPPEPTRNTGYEDYGAGPVASLVLRPNGDLAWIAETPTFRVTPAGRYQLYTLEATGRRMIASGDDIEPYSLALAAETIYWTQNGKPNSALLK